MITYSIDNNSIFAKYGLIGLFLNGLLSSIIPIEYYIVYSFNNFIRRFHKSPIKRSQDRSLLLLEKYGWIILFFSPWIPIMGDFIPIIAGIKKYNLEIFSISIILGKAVKALAIVFLSSWILPLFFP